MNNPFISYLVTTKNGKSQLKDLLVCIDKYIDNNECIILDDYSDDDETIKILNEFKQKNNFTVIQHHLNNHYSNHKNYGKTYCKGDYIFQIDDDEIPSENLMESLSPLILSNPNVECFLIPRINDFIGVNHDNARKWGWHLSPYENRLIVNFPDYQFRLFKNLSHINWERPLHEKVEGAKVITKLPPQYEWALKHNKTIKKQIETNLRYNRDFSEELNKGFKI